MRVTDRDVVMIKWLNGHNGVTVSQIAHWLKTDYSTAARRVRKLEDAGLVRRLQDAVLGVQPIAATARGCAVAGDPLPALSGVRVATE